MLPRLPPNGRRDRLPEAVKRLFSLLLRSVLLLTGAACTYVLSALLLGGIEVHADRNRDDESIRVYLHSNGVHTDIIVPMKNAVFDWHEVVNPAHSLSGRTAEYVAIGWGSRDFYLNVREWRDLSAAAALRAISGMDGSLIHVSFLSREPSRGNRTMLLTLSKAEYGRLTAQIRPYFQTNEYGATLPVAGTHYNSNDAFYQAKGRYHLFYTCNTWTNERLKQSGLPAVIWTPFAYNLLAVYD